MKGGLRYAIDVGVIVRIKGFELMATEDSEFGGAGGLIQPPPHNPSQSAAETAFLERATDPFDDTVGPSDILAEVLAGTYGRGATPEAAIIGPLMPDVAFVGTSPATEGFSFVGVGNQDLRTARLKVSDNRQMHPATYGPEKEISPSVAPVVNLSIGSLAPGHYFYQVLMNGLQVTDVWEVDVV
jgi:hypothetical protein